MAVRKFKPGMLARSKDSGNVVVILRIENGRIEACSRGGCVRFTSNERGFLKLYDVSNESEIYSWN